MSKRITDENYLISLNGCERIKLWSQALARDVS